MSRPTISTLVVIGAIIAGSMASEIDNALAADEYRGFSAPEPVAIRGFDGHTAEPFITRDGRYLLFNNLNGSTKNSDLHFAERVDDKTFKYKGEVQGVNTMALETAPSMDRNGMLYFVSTRSYGTTLSTLYRGRFTDGSVEEVELVPGVSRMEKRIVNLDAEVSADGKTLYFVDAQFGKDGLTAASVVMATSDGKEFKRDPGSEEILKLVNIGAMNYSMAVSADGLEMFFIRLEKKQPSIAPALLRTSRKSVTDPFEQPQTIAEMTGTIEGPTLTNDGKTLYFHMTQDNRQVIYCVTR